MSAPTTGSPNMDVTVVSKEMALLSNLLAAYTFIAGTSKLKIGHVSHVARTPSQRRTILNSILKHFSRPAWEDSIGVPGQRLRWPCHHTQRHRLPDTLSSWLSLWQQQAAPPSPQEEAPSPPSSPPPPPLPSPPTGHREQPWEHGCGYPFGGEARWRQRIRGVGWNSRPVNEEAAALRESSP